MGGLYPRQMQKLSEQQNEHSHLASFSSEMLQSIIQSGIYRSSPSQGQTKLDWQDWFWLCRSGRPETEVSVQTAESSA